MIKKEKVLIENQEEMVIQLSKLLPLIMQQKNGVLREEKLNFER
jgi:hypothetical protein